MFSNNSVSKIPHTKPPDLHQSNTDEALNEHEAGNSKLAAMLAAANNTFSSNRSSPAWTES